jgi:putative transposase
VKHAWIRDHRDIFPVKTMCQVLEVSTSGYYEAIGRTPSRRAVRHLRILDSVRRVHAESREIYGSRKIAETLDESLGLEVACRTTVQRAAQELGLRSKVRRRFRPTTTIVDPSKRPAPNVLDRDFTAAAPNRKWVADITYLRTEEGWAYLAVILDLFSRKIVGWSIGDSLATDLVASALRQAIESRRPVGSRLMHHSDQGCQYTSDAYRGLLNSMGIECSMSRPGACHDNAVAERFFWSLKYEWTNHVSLTNLEDARKSVFEYIVTFYNSKRIHQALGYRTPDQFEADHAPAVAV